MKNWLTYYLTRLLVAGSPNVRLVFPSARHKLECQSTNPSRDEEKQGRHYESEELTAARGPKRVSGIGSAGTQTARRMFPNSWSTGTVYGAAING